jgi:heme-degrading monooxygenase HmoA
MTTSIIQEGTSAVTLVNVFTVEPKDQLRLVEHWQQATEEVIRHLPGFISANVHRSLDGTKVINYAQWKSQDAFDAMRHNPEAAAHLRELGQIGTPAPVVCEVVSVHHI